MGILALRLGSKAKPMGGAGLKRCPLRQPGFGLDPMLTVGNADPDRRGKFPPAPPHWTMPFSGLAVFPAFCTREPEPSVLKAGSLAGLNALGSKLKPCLYPSR